MRSSLGPQLKILVELLGRNIIDKNKMIPNNSPWIKQLNRTRPSFPLDRNTEADVVIVGGGIAGASTAYFTLRDTKKTVILIEALKIAHGATGHNAGQVTSYFERPLHELVDEFGFDMAIDGQKSVEGSWTLVDQIVAETKMQTPIYRFSGYAGLSSLEQVIMHLKDNGYRLKGGMQVESLIVAEEWQSIVEIPAEFKDLYTVAPQKDILKLLETTNTDYIASLSYQKGCMNSALFVEEIIGYLLTTYKDCFSLFENSPVKKITLYENSADLAIDGYIVKAEKVILCTNGFENFSIENPAGKEIDTKFHHSIAGRIGYMSGYIEPLNNPPTAISYFPKNNERLGDPTGESYFYLTRRPHEHQGNNSFNLVCAGGPEKVLPNGAEYSKELSCSEEIKEDIDQFFRDNYSKYPSPESETAFCWHGLMGYTPNGVRRIGPEPINPALLYNLGCNGVGILLSIHGGKKISQFINGEKLPRSIFDPIDQKIKS